MNVWVKDIKELIKHRELLLMLAWKEIRVKYKEPILGFLWALLVPIFMTLIFMFVFTRLFKVPVRGYPFFIFLITGLFPWNLFALTFSASCMSILEGGALIKKVYFPREIVPLSIVLANVINFLFTLVIVVLFVIIFGIKPSIYLLLLPVAFILQILLISGLALIVAGAQVLHRDVKFLVEVGLLFWFYLSPIFYPLELVINISRNAFNLYSVNPFVGLISLYRVSLLGNTYLNSVPKEIALGKVILYSAICSIAIFLIGYRYFKKRESIYIDLVK
ncbi:MAG: ABC transporter permease [Candidatus Omnitrophota bacterium]